MKTVLTLEKLTANAAATYKNTDTAGKNLLIGLFGKETLVPQNIIDRVKSFEDACEVNGTDPNGIYFKEGTPDEIATKRIKEIVKALNEGTVLSYRDSSQKKWFPLFEFASSGFRFYCSYYYCASCYFGGVRLALKSEELANYIGKQFINEYLPIYEQ